MRETQRCARLYNAGVNLRSEPAIAANSAVWVISDGAAGNERQALALAGAMRLPAQVVRLQPRAPWRWFAPRLTYAARLGFPAALRRELHPPWPIMAIGCGRQAALLTRRLRQWSQGTTFTLQILDPRISAEHFDLVVAPRHDELHAANVIQTLGALNPIDDAWLARAALQFPALAQLPQPRTVLLAGGPRRGLALDQAWLEALIVQIERWRKRDGGSLLIATSRRTPAAWRNRLRGAFRNGCTCFWGGAEDGANPYASYLALADRIVVTPDSVNMLSEACAVGVPVVTSLPPDAPAKLAAFHAELRGQGWLHGVDVDFSTLRQAPPLREIAAVASKVWHCIEATRPDVGAALNQANASPAALAAANTAAE
jgi:mitochondrial fission protein ELM1